jgi:hypothetical protein
MDLPSRNDRDHGQGQPKTDAGAARRSRQHRQGGRTCADISNIEGIEIALDVEQLLYEVNTFLNAASLIHRLGKSQSRFADLASLPSPPVLAQKSTGLREAGDYHEPAEPSR